MAHPSGHTISYGYPSDITLSKWHPWDLRWTSVPIGMDRKPRSNILSGTPSQKNYMKIWSTLSTNKMPKLLPPNINSHSKLKAANYFCPKIICLSIQQPSRLGMRWDWNSVTELNDWRRENGEQKTVDIYTSVEWKGVAKHRVAIHIRHSSNFPCKCTPQTNTM